MSIEIRFWGVRGSCPAPGPDTAEVGGNTSCVEVIAGGTRLVLDSGTGLRGLGNRLLDPARRRGGAVELTVLLSHVHWDHIQGLPFFAPLYAPTTRVHLVGGVAQTSLREALRRQMSAPMFPVDFDELPSTISCERVADRQRLRVGDAEITVARANHPDAVYAYRVESGGRSVVYATDTEHYACVDPRLVDLARGADALIYDAQYLPEEYAGKVGWGHSTYAAGIELARAAGVEALLLFHHDPSRTDAAVRGLEARARALFPGARAAREGMEIRLGEEGGSLAA